MVIIKRSGWRRRMNGGDIELRSTKVGFFFVASGLERREELREGVGLVVCVVN